MHQSKNSYHGNIASQFKKTSLVMSLAIGVGGISTQALSAFPANGTLNFVDGVTGGYYGFVTAGSYFAMDSNGDGNFLPGERTALSQLDGFRVDGVTIQPATGSHSGLPDGSESPGIDDPWGFFGNTGMTQTTAPISVVTDDGAGNVTLGFSGLNVTWNGIPSIPMGSGGSPEGIAIVTCGTDCSNGDSYVLEYNAVVPPGDPSGFGGVPYQLHLEGTISAAGAPPNTLPDTANTIVGNSIDINVLANDSAADGLDVESVAIATQANPGLATPNTSGTVTYDPQTATAGAEDTFEYTVDSTIGVTSAPTEVKVGVQSNVAPVANNDSAAASTAALDNAGGAIIINVIANDTDDNSDIPGVPGGIDPTSITVLSQPTTGTCTPNPDGTITYAQTLPSVAVTSSCNYQVSDIDNSATPALTSNVATVDIVISGIQSDWDANLNPDIIPVLVYDAGVPNPSGNTADVPQSGTYFSMDVSASTTIYTTMTPGSDGGMIIGYDQITGLSHTGAPTGNEVAVLDLGWNFFGNTGMTFTKNGGITGNQDGTLEFGGDPAVGDGKGKYQITWNGIPEIDLGGSSAFPQDLGFAVINCDTQTPVDPANTAPCTNGDFFELQYDAHVPPGDESGFGGVQYRLRMNGRVSFLDGVFQTSQGNVSSTRKATSDVPEDADSQLQCIGGCFDYTVTGVTPGTSVSVVIPLTGGVPDTTVDGSGNEIVPELRVLRNEVWGNFVTTATDTVKSAPMVAGGAFGFQCPPPGDAGYGPLSAGDQCIEVTMMDNTGANNAPNDKDPNPGTVVDPSGIGLPAGAAFVDNRTSSSSSGCTVSGNTTGPLNGGAWWILTGVVAWLGWNRRRTHRQ